MGGNRIRNRLLTLGCVGGLFFFLWWAEGNLDAYKIRLLNLSAVYIILAVSYNLINGVTGQFSLEPNAFIAIGAYTSSLLTMSVAEKEMTFIIEPLIWPLNTISISFLPSLLIAGTVTAFLAFHMGFPVFRVHGDYLAIVTLGFGEIVRVLANNAISLTNGALGLKGIASYTNLWWSWGWAVFILFFIMRVVNSSYGRAMKAVREDELAAKAMGVNAFRTKMLAFILCGFFEGIGGGLLAHLITTISPVLFTFFLTFNLLIIIVIGGLGSITGSVIAAIAFAWGFELLRVVEEPLNLGFVHIPGIPGMRMVVFALILLVVMLFAPQGIMGRNEFSWNGLFRGLQKVRNQLFG